MTLQLVLQTFLNGLSLSCFYVLGALGLNIVLGVMGMANYAYGEFYMIAAYVVWLAYSVKGLNFLIAALLAIMTTVGLGLVVERTIFRSLRKNILGGAIATVGLMLILQVLIGQIFGLGYPKPVSPPIRGVLNIYGAFIPWQRFIIIIITVLLLGGLWAFLKWVKWGRAMRASAQDSEAASLQGISASRAGVLAMVISSILVGVAGVLMSPLSAVTPYMGHWVLLMGLIIVIVGGAGNMKGTLVASFIFGFLYTIITTVFDAVIANIVSVLCMAILLTVKPEGVVK